jgi:hypothetical protein
MRKEMEFCPPSYRNFRRRTFAHPSAQKLSQGGILPLSSHCVKPKSYLIFEAGRLGSRLFFTYIYICTPPLQPVRLARISCRPTAFSPHYGLV